MESLSTRVAQDYAHQNSAVIASRMRVLQCEAEETDQGIYRMMSALATLKQRRAVIEATLRGMASVIEKR